jgi:uncharacterized protein YcbK (DUF882 family)
VPAPVTLSRRTKLTPHFTWGEFAQRDGTLPPRATFDAYRRLCQLLLEPVRLAVGPIIVSSGYRSVAYNAGVGGAPASRHIPSSEPGAVAADVYGRLVTPRQLYEHFDRLGAGGLGLYPTHVHVDTRRLRARW